MNPAIHVHELNYSYGKHPVLNRVTFSIPRGDFFVIIGPNGSGKTTLLKLISGIIPLENGQIEVLGRSISSHSRRSLARTISLVPQMARVDFPFTVREIVLMGRSPHLGILGFEGERDLEAAQQAMAFTGVAHLADRKIDQLSGGEQQRVFISRAICQEPDIILLDEPTAALDLAHQIRLMDLMENLKTQKQVTIVMVSHDINLASMYGNHLLLLREGAIERIGAPDEVLDFKSLEATYNCRLLVDRSPLGGFPRVTPVPGKFQKP